MTLSILLRGHNFLERDRFGYPMDSRENARSLLDRVILPIRERYPDAKLYLATYDSPALADLMEAFQPCHLLKIDPEESTQLETFKEGLKHVLYNDHSDALLVARFDLEFKKSFFDWNLDINDTTIYFPWKEGLVGWRDHRSVGDAVHVIGKKSLATFHDSIIMCQLARRKNLHLLYYFMRTMTGKIRFIEDGYWDSNTVFSDPECDNPLYRIYHRIRSEHPSPFRHYALREIQGE